MSVKELEDAVANLSAEQLAKFRAWFSQFDADHWDQQLERDVASGLLDDLAREALAEHKAGTTTEL